MPCQRIDLLRIKGSQLDLIANPKRSLQMNRNQLPSRHRTSEEDLQPLKLLVFIANVKEQPQLAKHGIADLGPL